MKRGWLTVYHTILIVCRSHFSDFRHRSSRHLLSIRVRERLTVGIASPHIWIERHVTAQAQVSIHLQSPPFVSLLYLNNAASTPFPTRRRASPAIRQLGFASCFHPFFIFAAEVVEDFLNGGVVVIHPLRNRRTAHRNAAEFADPSSSKATHPA